uniref:aralkylamine N-acetyltransferase n=1 Tax=Plectus sambesii TaxID=2011161 RepID=A0A914WRJ0_9BILA
MNFLLEHFCYSEPTNVAVDLTPDEARTFWPDIVNGALVDPVSLIVFDDKDVIVAVRLCSIANRGENEDGSADAIDPDLPLSALTIVKLLTQVEADLWNLVPDDVNRLLKIDIVSVRGDQTRKGIANRLINWKLDDAKRVFGCQGIAAEATAFNSQRMFEKNGYRVLYEVVHKDLLDESGKPIIACKDDTVSSVLVFKEL